MKRILYSDYLFHNGIRQLNTLFMNALSKEFEVYYCSNEDYVHSSDIRMIYGASFSEAKGKFRIAFRIIRNAFKLKRIERKIRPDYVVIGAYETRTINIILKFFRPKAPLVLVENNNIDQLVNPLYERLYKKAMTSVYHIALEEYIEEYMISHIGVPDNLVCTVKFPYYKVDSNAEKNMKPSKKRYNIIALSDSNDDSFVERLLENYNSDCDTDIRIYIKSKKYSFESDSLVVNSTYLSDEAYKQLFCEADAVLLPFPLDYKYRISGNLLDAISNKKRVIATSFSFAQYVHDRYPHLVSIISGPEDIYSVYNSNRCDDSLFEQDIISFMAERNADKTLNSFKKLFALIDSNDRT